MVRKLRRFKAPKLRLVRGLYDDVVGWRRDRTFHQCLYHSRWFS